MFNFWYETSYNNIIANNLVKEEYLQTLFDFKQIKDIQTPHIRLKANLPKFLSTVGIDFNIKNSASIPYTGIDKNTKNFFPVELSVFSKAGWKHDIFSCDAFIYRWLESSNTEILIWYPSEGFWTATWPYFDSLMEKWPNNKIRFVFGNLQRPKWADKTNNLIYKSFDFFWYDQQLQPRPVLDINKQEIYDFTFYNRRYKMHRALPYFSLLSKGKLRKAKHSFLGIVGNSIIDDHNAALQSIIQNYYETEEKYCGKGNAEHEGLIHSPEFFDWSLERIMNPDETIVDSTLYLHDQILHSESYLDLVAETWAFNRSDHLFITEKTYRSIANGNIFLILGNPRTLHYLKSKGIETFNDLFDESYDSRSYTHWFDRWKIIEKNIDRWRNMGIEGRTDYYKKNFEKIRHNQDVLFSRNFKNDVEEILS